MSGPERFSCTLCGECCSGCMQVFLNPYDLFTIGRFLKVDHTRQLFDRRLVEWAPGQNGLSLPKIRFKTSPFPFCPFLINDFQEDRGLRGLCSLHPEHKPLVCRLAPLSREVDLDSRRESFRVVPPHPACPGCGQGDPLEEQSLEEELRAELDLEFRYYQLLAEREKEGPPGIRGLFLFALEAPFSFPPSAAVPFHPGKADPEQRSDRNG